jgi:hypothetical protein
MQKTKHGLARRNGTSISKEFPPPSGFLEINEINKAINLNYIPEIYYILNTLGVICKK